MESLWRQLQNPHTSDRDLIDAIGLLANDTNDIDLMLAAIRLRPGISRAKMARKIAASSKHEDAEKIARALSNE